MYRVLFTPALQGSDERPGKKQKREFAQGAVGLLEAHDDFWQKEPDILSEIVGLLEGQRDVGPREKALALAAQRISESNPFLAHLQRGTPVIVVGERGEVHELRLEFKGLTAEFDAERLQLIREAVNLDLRNGSQTAGNGVERVSARIKKMRALSGYKDRFSFYCGPREQLPMEGLTDAGTLYGQKAGGQRVESDFMVLSYPMYEREVSHGEVWGRMAAGLYHTLFHVIAADVAGRIGRWQFEGLAELYSWLCYELFLRESEWGEDPEFRQHYMGRFPGGEYEGYLNQARDDLGVGDPPGKDDAAALGLLLALLETDSYKQAIELVAHYRRRVGRDRAPWSELELRDFIEQCSAPQLAMLRVLAKSGGVVSMDEMLRGVGDALGRADFDGRAFAGTYAALQHRGNNLLRESLVEKANGGYALLEEYRDVVAGFFDA